MEFHFTPIPVPPNAIPCLAQITLAGKNARKVYWRAQVGVTNDALIVSALSNPPNPVLDGPPSNDATNAAPEPQHDTSTLSGKLAHLLHHDRKSAQAQPLTDFPGVIDGQPLSAISVPITSLDREYYSSDASATPANIVVPVNGDAGGVLRFEFDSWLASKAELEVLGTQIGRALAGEPVGPPPGQGGAGAGAGTRREEGMAEKVQKWGGRDTDGSTHPSGDAEYKEGWQKEW